MLARANIRKIISQSISLLLLVLISAFLLNVGLVLLVQFNQYFDKRAEELNAPHLNIIQSEDITVEQQLDFLKKYPQVKDVETVSIVLTQGEYYLNDAPSNGTLIFERATEEQRMNPPTLIGDSLPLDDSSILVPYLMKTSGGYDLGDEFNLILQGQQKSYRIAGFTEEITFGSLMNTVYRLYVTDNTYRLLSEELSIVPGTLRSVQLSDQANVQQLETDYSHEFFFSQAYGSSSSTYAYTLPITTVKAAYTSTATIMAFLMIAFAGILLAVCLVVIRFRIINSTEENTQDIGALRALGYTSRQIIFSIVIQFLYTTFVGALIGIFFAQIFLPTIAQVVEQQSALLWVPHFNFEAAFFTFLLVCIVVAIISLFVARRYKKVNPLAALQNKTTNQDSHHQRLSLEKTGGPLSLLLAVKQLFRDGRQATLLSAIIAVVTFASIASASLYYNIGENPDDFIKIMIGEIPHVALGLNEDTDAEELARRLEEKAEVRKVFGYQNVTLSADMTNVEAFVTEDFSMLEGDMLASGRYPKHDNEIAIGGNTARITGKGIGDTIKIDQHGRSKDYYVTGIIQMMNYNGIVIAMNLDGLRTIQDNFEFSQLYIYVEDGVDIDSFLATIMNEESGNLSSGFNLDKTAKAQYGGYGSIFGALTAVILALTFAVIVLALYTVMRTSILRRRQELGIQKALGFTTFQLMNQLALNYAPIIFAGIIIGSLIGYFGFNPLFVLIASNFGILETELPVPLSWTLLACFVLLSIAYIVSLIIASRVRKISPYDLIRE